MLTNITGINQIIVSLLYGCGLRVKEQILRVKTIHKQDLQNGFGAVYIPHNLSKKYPNTSTDIKWQYLFPAKSISLDKKGYISYF